MIVAYHRYASAVGKFAAMFSPSGWSPNWYVTNPPNLTSPGDRNSPPGMGVGMDMASVNFDHDTRKKPTF